MTPTGVRTTLSIDRQTYDSLAEVARKNDRSCSAEARVAIRRHIEHERALTSVHQDVYNQRHTPGLVRPKSGAAGTER